MQKKINWPRSSPNYWKEYNAWYSKTPKRKEANRMWNRIWGKTKHGKMVKKRCNENWIKKNHDKKIDYMRHYNSLPATKNIRKKYESKPERIQYKRDYAKSHRALRRSPNGMNVQLVQIIYEANIKHFGTLTCYLCLKKISFGKDNLEHKIPLSRGGKNNRKNLGVACKNCNLKKGNKTEGEYRASGIIT